MTTDSSEEERTMAKRDGEQKGAQIEAEGQHADKTHSRFIEILHETQSTPEDDLGAETIEGAHRLHEDREQHDETEKNSEKNRLARDGE